MRTIKNLPDILRECLDRVVPRYEVPTAAEIDAFFEPESGEAESIDDKCKVVVAKYIMRKFINDFIEEREQLAVFEGEDLVWAAMKKNYLEEYYAYHLIDLIPQVVERAQSLATSVVKCPPTLTLPPEFLGILREAFRGYIYGLYVACICVCRCVLEQLLEKQFKGKPDRLESYRRRDPNRRKKGKLEALIDRAHTEKILDLEGLNIAKEVQRSGNKAAHDGNASEQQAAKVLSDIQRLLRNYFLK